MTKCNYDENKRIDGVFVYQLIQNDIDVQAFENMSLKERLEIIKDTDIEYYELESIWTTFIDGMTLEMLMAAGIDIDQFRESDPKQRINMLKNSSLDPSILDSCFSNDVDGILWCNLLDAGISIVIALVTGISRRRILFTASIRF